MSHFTADDELIGDRLPDDAAPDPEDVAAARRRFSPEQKLLAGILARALADLTITSGPDVKAAATARDWLFGKPLPGQGWSFADVCDALGLNPDVVRRLAAETAAPRARRGRRPRALPMPPREAHTEDRDHDVVAA